MRREVQLLRMRQMILAYYYLFRMRSRRHFWVHPIYGARSREREFHTLMPRLREDPDEFYKYFRMNEAAFDKLLGKLRDRCHRRKHVLIRKLASSGSMYFKYKKSFSMLLLGICDHRYRLTYSLDDGTLGIPGPAPLPGTQDACELFFIADAAFPCTTHIMKPISGGLVPMEHRVYNYRARRVIENVFFIMAAKWRILLRPIEAEPDTTVRIVLAICALHNYLIDESAGEAPATLAETGAGNEDNGRWRQQGNPMMPLANRAAGNRPTQAAVNMRRLLVDFFNGDGAVDWQDEYA